MDAVTTSFTMWLQKPVQARAIGLPDSVYFMGIMTDMKEHPHSRFTTDGPMGSWTFYESYLGRRWSEGPAGLSLSTITTWIRE